MTQKYSKKAKEEAERICSAKAAGKSGGTNWGPRLGRTDTSQLVGLGAGGVGDLTGFAGPDKTTSRGRNPNLPKERNLSSPEELEARRRKLERDEAAKKAMAAYRMYTENRIEGFRIFLAPYPKKKWERIVQNAGGLPDGVDVAHSEFGDLLLVPVFEPHNVEFDTQPKHNRRRIGLKEMMDRQKFGYWIEEDLMVELQRMFGYIQWNSPILVSELEQFNIRLQ